MTDLLKPAAVAAMFGVKPDTLRQWRHRGQGPTALVLGPKTIRYRKSDVEAYLALVERGRR